MNAHNEFRQHVGHLQMGLWPWFRFARRAPFEPRLDPGAIDLQGDRRLVRLEPGVGDRLDRPPLAEVDVAGPFVGRASRNAAGSERFLPIARANNPEEIFRSGHQPRPSRCSTWREHDDGEGCHRTAC